jgi:uncharacterized protein
MQHPVNDEALMEEAFAPIRRAITDQETVAWQSSRGQTGAKPTSDPGLLSPEATVAIGSTISTLTETVRKGEPTLEGVVREALRPMLKSWLDENLPGVVERIVQVEIERVIRGR